MNVSKEHQRINTVLDNYRSWLDSIPDEQFDETPPSGGWSYAEVYSHIMQATMAASIALERCTHSTAKPVTGKLNFWGWYVMLTSRFPPLKTKVPQGVATKMTATKISKEEAKNWIIKCHKRLDEMAKLIANASTERRTKHPRLGSLTAAQWLKFIRIHLQHHVKQLGRIRREFKF